MMILWCYLLTSVLYLFSFPIFDLSLLGWICLVPFIIAVDQEKNIRAVVGHSFICGLVIFVGGMYWLINVTWLGLILLASYLALYIVLFGIIRFYCKEFIVIPVAWTALEYVRGSFLGGIPWLLLGASQYRCLPVIQLAGITGVYGISFLVALVNGALASRKWVHLVITVSLLGVVVIYGKYCLDKPSVGKQLKVAVVQPNIPQDIKMDSRYNAWMMNRLEKLTEEIEGVLFVVWPETAVPQLSRNRDIFDRIRKLAGRLRENIILGSQGVSKGQKRCHYNSAFIISPSGEVCGEYRKMHLVPFGEYVPFKSVFPFLKGFTPIDEGFCQGDEYKVFQVRNSEEEARVAVVICFEDIFPSLARRFVRQGAQLLVNITNDAWFGNTAAVYQHAYLSVFRTVENNVPLVRATNTGLSCFIDNKGRISKLTPFAAASVEKEITISESNEGTFYNNHGDLLCWVCIILLLLFILRYNIKVSGKN